MTVESTWHNTAGDKAIYPDTWNNNLRHIDKIQSLVGVLNDEDALCIGLVPFNRQVMAQVAGAGCTIWFNEDDEHARFGIRFPLGSPDMAMKMMRNIAKNATIEQLADIKERETVLELLNADHKTVAAIPLEEAAGYGIAASVREYNGRLLLAVRVPFAFTIEGTEYRIERTTQIPIPVVIEAPAVKRPSRDEEAMAPPSGMSGDSYMRRDSRQREMSQPGFAGFQVPIRLELKVRLAV